MVATAPQGGEKRWPDMETLLGIRNHRVNGFTRTEPFFADSQHIGSGVSHPSRAIVPYYILLHCGILYNIMLYFVILYYTISYYIIIYYIVQHCAISYDIILY